ncbi:MAG: hypothetical protein A2722_01420 [Candidatus Doudnabacteria bacterium RIFCSPHIGHO2_01_FULL_50_11]|uniref:Amidophosphoribosyltransferase n=1 Tax=Candidatus Doudnabacteria bacterium RIFCSPHIGHO2_01_FULL_50_11 TaxID=1817828 RepID=A0A1F5PHZ9_9BACT|nr:MAG: hypothetical protein A2722_01420 [Candidatus Doudnabacteria bacterium RIFCSPHIGHO2_01_FULL_50_11]
MCGIVGMSSSTHPVAFDMYVGLWALQHRGKESAGMALSQEGEISRIGGMGEVPRAFRGLPLQDYTQRVAIGQVRYSTAGVSGSCNLQPVQGEFRGHDFFLVHNGNIVNVLELKEQLGGKGEDGENQVSDTVVISRLLSASPAEDFPTALADTARLLHGSFNLIALYRDTLYALVDSHGFHPLQIGRRGDDIFVSSESCVFDQLGGELVRDLRPGEIVVSEQGDWTTGQWCSVTDLKFDVFEWIYFLRPDTVVHDTEAGMARRHMGRMLANEHPADADIVVPIPDSANEAALGYYEQLMRSGSSAEFEPWALFRPHTVSRTFIEPVQAIRKQYIKLKFNPRRQLFKGRRVVLIDDSIVRGNTLEGIVGEVRAAGAKEVHVRITSPMYLFPDFYGIDTYREARGLIARNCGGCVQKIADTLRLDSLGYLSLHSTIHSVLKASGPASDFSKTSFYTGPFTGEYPAGQGDFASIV